MKRIIRKLEPAIPKLPRLLRVAAYARVSSGKDAMLHSLSAQVSYYSKLIQNTPSWQYAGVYADEALSGTKDRRKSRPDHHKIHLPVCPQYGDDLGDRARAQPAWRGRVF